MEFLRENQVVDSCALKILGQCIQVSARVRQRRLTYLGHDQPGALDANLQTIQAFRDRAERFVGAIQTLKQARMLPFVKACGTQKKVQPAKGPGYFDQIWFLDGSRKRFYLSRGESRRIAALPVRFRGGPALFINR